MQPTNEICPVYGEPVLPDEDDKCSLCGKHSASVDEPGFNL